MTQTIADTVAAPRPDRRRLVLAVAWLVLAVAVASFAVRGVWRGAVDSGDLAVGYAAARAWMAGENPYDPAVLDAILSAAGGPTLQSGNPNDDLRNVYVPTTIPMFVPTALPTWLAGRLIGLAFNTGASIYLSVGLLWLLDWRRITPRALFLVAFLLALAPMRGAIAAGQTGIVSVALIVATVLLQRSGRGIAAGVALALATAVKVQIGLPFIVYYAWRRRWPSVSAAIAVLGGMTVISVGRMALAGVDWLPSWLANVDLLSEPGGLNDPGMLNPQRYSMVNLQYLLESIGMVGQWAEALVIVAVGVAAILTVVLIRGREPRRELLALSIVAVLTLLVTYHRYYDAVLLALPLAWAFGAVRSGQRAEAVLILLLCGLFILPIPTNLWDMQQAGVLPAWIGQSVLWEPVILAHEAWALVVMVPILLSAARGRAAHERAPLGDEDMAGGSQWRDRVGPEVA